MAIKKYPQEYKLLSDMLEVYDKQIKRYQRSIESTQSSDKDYEKAIQQLQEQLSEATSSLNSLNLELTYTYQISQSEPSQWRKSSLWVYQNICYEVTGSYSDEEKKLLILEFVDKERQKFEHLKRKFSQTDSEELKYERTRIPESVRIAVWRRDQGKCARCGSRENLEYDHIVPVSKGGGNTERNIELLCQDCNRTKGNRIE